MFARVQITPGSFNISCTQFCFQLPAPSGCSCKKYLPVSCCICYNKQLNLRCSIACANLSRTSASSIRLQLKFMSVHQSLHIGLPIGTHGVCVCTICRARRRISGSLKSHGRPSSSFAVMSHDHPGFNPCFPALSHTRGGEKNSDTSGPCSPMNAATSAPMVLSCSCWVRIDVT